MEALVLIFAEILLACLAPLLAAIGALLGAILELIFALLGLIFGEGFERWRKQRRAQGAEAPASRATPRRPLVPRRWLHWAAGSLAALGVLGVLASVLFMQPILRYVLTTAADKTGAEVSFERASGTLLLGDVTLYGLQARREGGADGLGFDMAVRKARADVDIWTLLSREPVIERAEVEGVSGHVSPPQRDKDRPRPAAPGERRPFSVLEAAAHEVAVEIRPKDSAPYLLEIDAATVAPFRSRLALFDLMFRSNMTARIAGQTLIVETAQGPGNARDTRWLFEEVEAEKVKLLVPKAPLTWLQGGRLSVRVEDSWSLTEDRIDMDWQIGFDDVVIQVPQEAGRAEKLLGASFAKLVDARDGQGEFRYRLSLDKDQIAALRSGDLQAFWDVVLSGVLKRGPPSERAQEQAQEQAGEEDKPGALDKLKNLLKREAAE